MNCRECQQLMQRVLDGDPTVAYQEDWAAHLAICTTCHDLDTAAQYLLDGLRFLAPPQPPAGLLERICQQALVERVRAARWRRLLVNSAVAAGIMLTCSLAYLASHTVGKRNVRPALALSPQRSESVAATSLHRRLEEAGLAVVALTRRTADETVGQTKLLLPVSIPPRPTHTPPGSTRRPTRREEDDLDTVWAQALEPPARSLREIQDGMAAGLEPVAASARRAFGFFVREFPPAESRMQ